MRFALAEWMAKRGFNAYRLSQALEGKVGRSSVYRLASGEKVKVTPEEIAHLCEALDVSPNELFGYKAKRGKG